MTATIHSHMTIANEPVKSQTSASQRSSLYDYNQMNYNAPLNDINGTIAVVAPCDMGEGYTFMVTANSGFDDDTIPVTVPPGGVRQGQIFYAKARSFLHKNQHISNESFFSIGSSQKDESSNLSERAQLIRPSTISKSINQWKDRWYDCCRLGLFHVTLWNAFCCPQILMAQILNRLHLNWLGDPIETDVSGDQNIYKHTPMKQATHKTFCRILLLVISYWCLTTITDPNHLPGPISLVSTIMLPLNTTKMQRNNGNYLIYNLINLLYGLYTLCVLTKLRYHVRRLYHIAPTNPLLFRTWHCNKTNNPSDTVHDHVEVDDCCVTIFCGCCSVAQMARQTASYVESTDLEYQTETAACCSFNGLSQQL
jgi:hypothetical protein